MLSRIRLFSDNPYTNIFRSRSPSQLDVWRRLDDILCGLCPQQTQNEYGGLTFQIASRRTDTPYRNCRLFGPLPNFSRVGTYEEIEVGNGESSCDEDSVGSMDSTEEPSSDDDDNSDGGNDG